MSNNTGTQHKPTPEKPDLTLPIARSGEQIYASIQRERSGVDAGVISPSVRVFAIDELGFDDQQSAVSAGLLLLEMIVEHVQEQAITTHSGLAERVFGKFVKAAQAVGEGK